MQHEKHPDRDGRKSRVVQDVIVSWPVKQVDTGLTVFGEVVGVHLATDAAVHVLDAHTDTQVARQRDDVDVVTLLVHGLNFLFAELLNGPLSINEALEE